MNTHTLELDLSKDGLGAGLVRVGQGDKHGTTIKALIYDGGAEAALTGFTAYLEVLLPNKRNYYRAAAAISGNAATVTVDENFAVSPVTPTKPISRSRKTACATQRSASQSRFCDASPRGRSPRKAGMTL